MDPPFELDYDLNLDFHLKVHLGVGFMKPICIEAFQARPKYKSHCFRSRLRHQQKHFSKSNILVFSSFFHGAYNLLTRNNAAFQVRLGDVKLDMRMQPMYRKEAIAAACQAPRAQYGVASVSGA